MPYFAIVDKSTGKRLREALTLNALFVHDPQEIAVIDEADRQRKLAFGRKPTIEEVFEVSALRDADIRKATGRLLDPETEELVTLPDVDTLPDGDVLVWDASERTLVAAPAAKGQTPSVDTRLTLLAFKGRFTLAERVAIEIAQQDHADPEVRAMLRMIEKDMEAAPDKMLDRADQHLQFGVQYLVQVGLLAQNRALEIIGADALGGA